MTTRTILLLDIDGVLIHPGGYFEALRRAVNHFGRQLGYPPIDLTAAEIATFEAAGMASEFLSGAFCLAHLIVGAAQARPSAEVRALHDAVTLRGADDAPLPRPDFAALAADLRAAHPEGVFTSEAVLRYLTRRVPDELHAVLASILGDIFPPGAPFARVFQQYVLGHAAYQDLYGESADIQTDSLLRTHDTSNLSAESARYLNRLAAGERNGAAIITARPSLPPPDLTAEEQRSIDPRLYSPEGELALDLAGLSRDLPLMGAGRMMWLAVQSGYEHGAFIKPSPVQSLAAIAAALTGEQRESLLAARALAEDSVLDEPLAALTSDSLHVIVIEDSAAGIRSASAAADLLNRAGARCTVESVGIITDPVKKAGLQAVGCTQFYASIDEAVDALKARGLASP